MAARAPLRDDVPADEPPSSDAAVLRAMLGRLEAAAPRDDRAIAAIKELLAAVIAKQRESNDGAGRT